MSDTPRTNEEMRRTAKLGARDMEGAWMEMVYFACELERELRKLAAGYADLKVYGRKGDSA